MNSICDRCPFNSLINGCMLSSCAHTSIIRGMMIAEYVKRNYKPQTMKIVFDEVADWSEYSRR